MRVPIKTLLVWGLGFRVKALNRHHRARAGKPRATHGPESLLALSRYSESGSLEQPLYLFSNPS